MHAITVMVAKLLERDQWLVLVTNADEDEALELFATYVFIPSDTLAAHSL